MAKSNANKPRRERRKPSKHTKARMSSASASKPTPSSTSTPVTATRASNRSRISGSGTTRAVGGATVTQNVRAISKKKAKKQMRDEEYKRKRRLAEALEREGEVEMRDIPDAGAPILNTKKALRKAKIAAEGQKLAEEKEEAANAMEVDA